ncbi:trypsin-like serine peptidase [Bdellovibrio sp. HCB337]|uniref:trypsin-like serine peptidase n=1 Tax=Bdellovibrio sp. HCB337 TaxID=3394358 RepID=UPI0039A6C42D
MVKAILLVAICYFLSPIAIAKIQNKVIYGDDNRMQYFQVPRADVREVADSTAAVIRNSALTAKSNGMTTVKAETFQRVMGLCSSEPYATEPSGAFCSAFLVGDDLMATAGHCIDAARCAQSSFVFSYRMSSQDQAPSEVESSEVYTCKSVIERAQTGSEDYALVRLDRPVRGHRPLTLARSSVKPGDNLIVVGHPSGIPTKVTDNGIVRSVKSQYFTASLDTYGGNSGSAVFNQDTLEVVGILVRGESDFVYDSKNRCSISNRCTEDGCRGEDVTQISYISQALSKAQ